MSYPKTLQVWDQVQEGDQVEVTHEVKVGFRQWKASLSGVVVKKERRRHGLHHQRSADDKVFSDYLVLRGDDGELTTATIDEFTELRVVEKR